MNIIQWLLENNHAKAQRHAENIIVLLKLNELYDLKDYEGIKARVLLYEAWKTSGLYDKKDRAACAMKAIAGEPVPAPVVDMFAEVDRIFAELPQIGDVYEFDYVYNERGKTTERLIVVAVTDTHVMYKMPGVSVNKIFPMDYETWKANTDERRKVKALAEQEAE